MWVYGEGHKGVSFCVGGCVLRECVVEGGGLYGYFGEQGLPAGIKECLERFHRRSVDYLSRQFVPNVLCTFLCIMTATTSQGPLEYTDRCYSV